MTINCLEGMCKKFFNVLKAQKAGNKLNELQLYCLHNCNGYHNNEHNGCSFNPKTDIITKKDIENYKKTHPFT